MLRKNGEIFTYKCYAHLKQHKALAGLCKFNYNTYFYLQALSLHGQNENSSYFWINVSALSMKMQVFFVEIIYLFYYSLRNHLYHKNNFSLQNKSNFTFL